MAYKCRVDEDGFEPNIFGSIYKITSNINGKSYIGQTIRKVHIRIAEHRKAGEYSKSNTPLHNAIRKYGWENFTVTILESNIPLENLNIKELEYTLLFNALSPNGFVLNAGGGEHQKFSQETLDCLSKKLKGIPKTKEHAEKISKRKKEENGKLTKSERVKKFGWSKGLTKETDKRLQDSSEKRKGKVKAWNKGLSKKTDFRVKKYSEARKGHSVLPETIDKCKKTKVLRKEAGLYKPIIRTKEWGDKISKGKMGHQVSKETREKLRLANLGKKHSQETKDKIIATRKKNRELKKTEKH